MADIRDFDAVSKAVKGNDISFVKSNRHSILLLFPSV